MSDSSPPPPSPAAAGRTCGDCTLCCKVLAIAELDKPQGVWCRHCVASAGCRIYADRPMECRTFSCGWLVDARLGEEWRPSRSRIILVASAGQNRLAIHVDPARPGAWRQRPYYGQLKEWAHAAARVGGQVVVYLGRAATVILPDRDVPVGTLGDDDVIVVSAQMTPHGPRYEARRVRRDEVPGRPR